MNPIVLTLGANIDKIFYKFDMFVFNFFGSIQNSFFNFTAKLFTTFGDENFIIPIMILAIAMCFFKKTRKYGVTLVFAIIIGTLVTNVALKPLALRIRPYNTLQGDSVYMSRYAFAGSLSESDYSFPSGHTTGAFEIAVSLFLCFNQDKKKTAYIFPAVALCTAGSRIYLMVHYASDVVAGIIVGTLAGLLGYLIMKLIMSALEKKGINDKLDAGKLFKLQDGKKRNVISSAVIGVCVTAIFLFAFIPSLSDGNEQKCAYDGEYKCNNAAKVDDADYPPIDGKEYCKIHWKQLNDNK